MMQLGFIKFINVARIVVVFTISILLYLTLGFSESDSWFSAFQHPFMTMTIITGWWILVFPLDFNSVMFVSRFQKITHQRLFALLQLTVISSVYIVSLMAVFGIFGHVFGESFLLERILSWLLLSFLSVLVLNAFLVYLTPRIGSLLTKIVLFCLMFIQFVMNYASDFFVKINFLFFNMNSIWSMSWVLPAVSTYVLVCALFLMLNALKEREL